MVRTRASAKKAGSTFERNTADHAMEYLDDDSIDRKVKTGRNDKGDVGGIRTSFGERVLVECKDTAKVDLGNWRREVEVEMINDNAAIGVVVHKRFGKSAPGQQWVTMTYDDFLRIIGGPRDE